MTTKKKSPVSNEDLLFLLQKLYDKFGGLEGRFDGFEKKNHEDHERMMTMISNLVGSVARIEEELVVINHHNSEHFEKDKQQDVRLDTIESKLQLPKFAY